MLRRLKERKRREGKRLGRLVSELLASALSGEDKRPSRELGRISRPDAHVVALMLENGVRTIWTHDRDYRRFSGIETRDPFA